MKFLALLYWAQESTQLWPLRESIQQILRLSPQMGRGEIHEVLIEFFSKNLIGFREIIEGSASALLQLEEEMAGLSGHEVQVIVYGEELFPTEFYYLPDPPWLIFLKGPPLWKSHNLLSVVGSREMSSLSERWVLSELSSFIRGTPVGIVSGGAIGVDQAAHCVSLRERRPTLVVLPCGHQQLYPNSLLALAPHILDAGGALISEYLPNEKMRKHHFQRRNRLIAVLGRALVIVQAAEKGGSLMTAHRALEYGRSIWVVPSHPLDKGSRGGLELLRMGATILVDAEDLSLFFNAETQSLNLKTL